MFHGESGYLSWQLNHTTWAPLRKQPSFGSGRAPCAHFAKERHRRVKILIKLTVFTASTGTFLDEPAFPCKCTGTRNTATASTAWCPGKQLQPRHLRTVCVNASSEKGKQVLGVIMVQAVWSQGHLAGVTERTPRTLVQGAFSWGQRAESSHGPTRAQ